MAKTKDTGPVFPDDVFAIKQIVGIKTIIYGKSPILFSRRPMKEEELQGKAKLDIQQIIISKIHPGSDINSGLCTMPVASFRNSLYKTLVRVPGMRAEGKKLNNAIRVFGINPYIEEKERYQEENLDPEYMFIKGESFIDQRYCGGSGKTQILNIRPGLLNWKVHLLIKVDITIATEKFVRDLIENAGNNTGIGSYRVECGGEFGKFTTNPDIAEAEKASYKRRKDIMNQIKEQVKNASTSN